MSTLSDYKDRLAELLPYAEANLDDSTARQSAITASLHLYSRLRPRVKAEDYEGDGSTYTFTLPADYYDSSRIVRIEWDQGEQVPGWLDPVYYTIYYDLVDSTLTPMLRLYLTPGSSDTVRLYYTTLHTINESGSSVPDGDFEALCQLAAYHLASTLAGHYASKFQPSLEGYVISYRTKSDQYRSLATQFLNAFKLYLGMKSGDAAPAAAVRRSLVRDKAVFRTRL